MKRIPGVRGRLVVLAALVVGAGGLAVPAEADDGPLPDACTLHPVHVVNPGCVPALTEAAGEAVDDLTGPVLNPPETYPDLVPHVESVFAGRPITGIDPVTFELTYGPPELAFDTWAQNLGSVNLDLLSDDPANTTNPTVSQCVLWAAEVCRARRQVGGFEVHPGHNHIHFNEFARYELRSLLPDGTPDYSAAGLLDISDKVSFCLLDSVQVRDSARPAPAYIGCTAAREGISAGWADIYGSSLDGQQLVPENGLTDGRYALVISLNYAQRLYEADNGNNVVEVIVEVSNDVTQATVLDRRWP